MQIKFFCPYWGSEHLKWDVFFEKVKEVGYDGIEMSLPTHKHEREKIISLINEYELDFVAQHWETTDSDFEAHKKNFEAHLHKLMEGKPLLVNSQTGKDYYNFVQNSELFEIANKISTEYKTPIVHETHRGKWSFAAHITKQYLEKLPMLRIAADFSHWCATAESFLHDQKEALELAISRTDHIHTRVGFPQGPQVNDPFAPEWAEALETHTIWWDKIVMQKEKSGAELLTMTAEFGPVPYMPSVPFTLQPIANQWNINQKMMEMLKERYLDILD